MDRIAGIDSLPCFETERLVLRPRTLDDTEACLAMDQDREVIRYVGRVWPDEDEHRAFIRQRTQGPYPAGLGYWTVVARDAPDLFLGWLLLIPEDQVGPAIEIGWRFLRASWGRGYATEAARPLLHYAFDRLRLDAVVAEIHPENHASLSAARKLGFVPDAAMPMRDGALRFTRST